MAEVVEFLSVMHFFFADDSRQPTPTRPKMGPLVATGGFLIDADRVKALEGKLARLCKKTDFPDGQAFKWSPSKDMWMARNLIGSKRRDFFLAALDAAADLDAKCVVVVADDHSAPATSAKTTEADVTALLLERIDNNLRPIEQDGIVIVARPQGGRTDEDKFLADCLEVLQSGTAYVEPRNIAINVLTSPANLVRCLQLADIVASCSTACVAGEATYSPPVFAKIKTMLAKDGDRVGGIGLKIHPDIKYVNLYHWLVDDDMFWKRNTGHPLPMRKMPFAASSTAY